MIIKIKPDRNCTIELNEVENKALINSIRFIIEYLGEDELESRTSFSINEYEVLSRFISSNAGSLHFNRDQQIMLHQALNEVGNGIFIPDYEKQIGMSPKEIRKMLVFFDEQLDLPTVSCESVKKFVPTKKIA